MDYPKKLIEVALPLDDINAAAETEKSPFTKNHPRSMHIWWARRPLAAVRAVLFAQLVNDPGGKRGYGAYKGQTKEDAQKARDNLFQIIRDLVIWKNTNNGEVLERAKAEIIKSWKETCQMTGEDPQKMPPFLDPFAGGGAIPLEAQRFGFEANASDLNPVAVMINKAIVEIPPKFADRSPIGPIPEGAKGQKILRDEDFNAGQGLAEDILRYGHLIKEEAKKRIGHLYPDVEIPAEHGGGKANVIAYIWARTVLSPSPAFRGVAVPLVSSFFLSNKKGKEVYLKPTVEGNEYSFRVKYGKPDLQEQVRAGTKEGRGGNFRCLVSGVPISVNYIRAEGKAGRMGVKLLAVVAKGKRRKLYLSSNKKMESIANCDESPWYPNAKINYNPRDIRTQLYGLEEYGDLFTKRQLVALTTFSDILLEIRDRIISDAMAKGWEDDGKGLNDGGTGATAYAEALCVYFGLGTSRWADMSNSICGWNSTNENVRALFARQAIPMSWDFAELSPFSKVGQWYSTIETISKAFINLPASEKATSIQADARHNYLTNLPIISTDPPYYDNIAYADLSDFFYVWLRRTLKPIFPEIFSTMLVPKEPELVANQHRHGTKEEAEQFFLEGMSKALANMATNNHPAFPVTIYYAFKQSETGKQGTASTGWETFLEAVIKAGFLISGTWPMRTERAARSVSIGANALASSIVLVCRKRRMDASIISRKQFINELEETLPEALEDMIGGKEGASPIAPVDLAQAAIGPGMAVFSKYAAVLEADGSPMTVHTALILINKTIDEYFTHAESNMGSDTRFCVDWFQQYGFETGPFGEADVLARAKGTSVEGVADAGVIRSGGGNVRLLKTSEYSSDWDPVADQWVPIWEACHHMCRALEESEIAAGTLLAQMSEKAEPIRQLAYRLYTLCERNGWAEEARLYNGLITSWRTILEASHEIGHRGEQLTFDV